MSDLAAPDYAEPLEAWRTWRVVSGPDGPRLSSLFFEEVWKPNAAVEARCNRRSWLDRFGRFRQAHAAPGEHCECGVYGARIEQAAAYLWHPRIAPRRAHLHVLGRVRLWGDVVECERGYRAALAYPAELIVPALPGGRSGEIADGLGRYGVPVRLVECRTREEIVQAARDTLRPAA
ncbi:MAG: hypothetical protein JO073_14315 [Actinobacteria bacterium]|nr:hypothetical protein [Actinomycetota bacterium]